ncbi:uncharacterized protein LOC121909971 isoform X1 [Scomber scombrus]|uniref:Uncharacterized protein LOC121909971 isoform X1 n=1 Tax=Scomber scombrus TaxID=13677 RepID=A0AAV1N3I0_SCOSC
MPCKEKEEITSFLFVVTIYFYPFQLCSAASLAPWPDVLNTHQHRELRPESTAFPGKPFPDFIGPKLDENDSNFAQSSLSWTLGDVSTLPRAWPSHSEDEYQRDFTSFHGVQGKVSGPSFDSSPHLSQWLAMRPVVQCDRNVMIFTASGERLTQLLVDREGASPISLSQLPPYCGYSVRTSWRDLEMMVPYDACYITQENGSYVLPMLWLGNPLNLSCPIQMSILGPSLPHSAPSVFCSPYGMAVQIDGQEQDMHMLGIIVNGGWAPFVSEECAYHVNSQPENLLFFIFFRAPCVTRGDGLHLQLTLDEQEYILTCPVNSQVPFVADPAPNSPSPPPPPTQPPTQEQQLPDHLHYPYPGLQYPQLPQVYPPGSQPVRTPLPTPGSPPGLQPQESLHPSESVKLPSSAQNPEYPSPQATSASKLPAGPSQYPSGLYYPLYYPAMMPAPTLVTKKPTTTSPPATQPPEPQTSLYYLQYYYLAPTAAPVTPVPTPSPPNPPSLLPSPSKQPVASFYPPDPYRWYLTYDQMFYSNPGLDMYSSSTLHPPTAPPSPPPTPTTTTTMVPKQPSYPSSQFFYHEGQIYFMPPTPVKGAPQSSPHEPQQPAAQLATCPPYFHPICSYYPYPYYPYYHPLYPSHYTNVPQYPKIEPPVTTEKPVTTMTHTTTTTTPTTTTTTPTTTTTSSTTPTPTQPAPQPPHVQCFMDKMVVFLPFAHQESIQVRDIKGNQMNIQDAPKHCGYSASKRKDGKIRLSFELHSRCQLSVQGKMYTIAVVYMTANGRKEHQFSCPVSISGPRQECNLPSEQRLPCGSSSVSQPQCLSIGCCFSKHPPACYYPMDECTLDRHFVFSVPASLTEPPLSPSLLVAAGNSTCKPQKVTSDSALFKIPMDGCGARRMEVGKTLIYMVEIINMVQAISLNYGTITRDSPVRLLVECRYVPSTTLAVSYLVKTPTLGPVVQTQGMFGVQLRIAKDAQYSSYHPQYHQPLQMLLGKPLYLEVRLLNTPDPNLVLLVHYCVAYPRSGKAVWVLLYNGCPNPLDPAPQQAVLSDPQPPSPQAQTRRFTISTFQFLPDGELKDTDEEIYFMCSTEICSPRDGPCVEGCFGQ